MARKINFMVEDGEWKKIRRAAKADRRSISSYVRDKLIRGMNADR